MALRNPEKPFFSVRRAFAACVPTLLLAAPIGIVALLAVVPSATAKPDEPPPAAVSAANKTTNAHQVRDLLQKRCYECHGKGGVATRAVFVNDVWRLKSAKMVVPGDTAHSPLLQQVVSGAMPPRGARLSDSEIALLRVWIQNGAPDWNESQIKNDKNDTKESVPNQAAQPRRFLSEGALLERIHADLLSLPDVDRQFYRYFSIAHLWNAGASPGELAECRTAMGKAINSLSWKPAIVVPTPVGQEKVLFRIDLRDCGWKPEAWAQLASRSPYAVRTPKAETIYQLARMEGKGQAAYLRADWFVAKACTPPLYHQILGLPETVGELEEMLGVDANADIGHLANLNETVRGGLRLSGVSRSNRVLERHIQRGGNGAYWKSFDFRSSLGQNNIFRDPLTLHPAGGEIIFNLPNGLQAYFIMDADGNRIDAAPIDIVADRTRPENPQVTNGLSCISCHADGMKPFRDDMRPVLEQGGEANFDRGRALVLYSPPEKRDKLLASDRNRFLRALAAIDPSLGSESESGEFTTRRGDEPISLVARRFDADLTLAEASAEAGLTPEAFMQKFEKGAGSLQSDLGTLFLSDGGSGIKRDVWEDAFPLVVEALGTGETIVKAKARGSHRTRGVIFAAGDEWITSDSGFADAGFASTRRYVRNVVRFLQTVEADASGTNDGTVLSGKRRANILIYSSHWTFGAPFQDVLRQDRHTVTQTLTPESFDPFDIVFVGGDEGIDREKLLAYVRSGGKVYISGAAGLTNEKEFWNTFLAHVGLQYNDTPVTEGIIKIRASASDPALFTGVEQIKVRGPFSVAVTPEGKNQGAFIAGVGQNNTAYFGVGFVLPDDANARRRP